MVVLLAIEIMWLNHTAGERAKPDREKVVVPVRLAHALGNSKKQTMKPKNQPTKQKLLWKRRLLNTRKCKSKDLLVRL